MHNLLKRKTLATNFSNLYTPSYATKMLLPYLKKGKTVWECASGKGHITNVLIDYGMHVVETDIVNDPSQNFLTMHFSLDKYDYIITNPPYGLGMKDQFLKRCYELEKPFALLLPLTALGAHKRVEMYIQYGLELLVPDKRINFIYTNAGKANWFHCAWFCHNLLPEPLMFVEIDRA